MAARRIYTLCPGRSEHHDLAPMMGRNRGMSSASLLAKSAIFRWSWRQSRPRDGFLKALRSRLRRPAPHGGLLETA